MISLIGEFEGASPKIGALSGLLGGESTGAEQSAGELVEATMLVPWRESIEEGSEWSEVGTPVLERSKEDSGAAGKFDIRLVLLLEDDSSGKRDCQLILADGCEGEAALACTHGKVSSSNLTSFETKILRDGR